MKSEPATGELDELVKLLQSIFNMTIALQEACATGELEKAAGLLQKRENLIHSSLEIRKRFSPDLADLQSGRQYPGRIAPLVRAIERENEQLMKTLAGKRKEALDGLQQIQNQKSILAYTR